MTARGTPGQGGIRARLCALAVLALLAPAAARAGVANRGLPDASRSNPIAGMHWGVYTGFSDGLYAAYASSRGRRRALLGKIATRSIVHWFGAWVPDGSAQQTAQRYVQIETADDPKALVPVAVFRLVPWEQQACGNSPGPNRQASFRRWINGFASGIASARTLVILQPDIPFALCSPGRAEWLRMLAYATSTFSALPYTTVYIDSGAWQWASVTDATAMLKAAGIRHARGLALNDTEYDSTSNELVFGQAILDRLASQGVGGKHMVINTAENGVPFLNGQYPGDVSNPRVCSSSHDHLCVTLGIPPTTNVTDPRWHLGPRARSIAARSADGYLWVGRPWLDYGSNPFDLPRALGLAASSPF